MKRALKAQLDVETTMIDALIPRFDTDKLASSYQSAVPFPHIAISNFLDDSFAREVAESFPSLEDVQAMGRSFKAVNEKGKTQVTDSALFPPPILRLHELLASPEFLARLSTLTGIPNLLADPEMVGGGIHETGPRGHLDVHVDFNYIEKRELHRRLNVLIYFNDPWEDDWGGNFELWDKTVSKCHASVSPKFNQMCMFTTSDISYHGVTAVKCPQGQSRKSFAAYYYTKEAPENWDGNASNTIFKPRPEEKFKGQVLMPLQSAKYRLRQMVKRLIGRS